MEPKFQLNILKIDEVSKEKAPKRQIACIAPMLYSPIRKLPISFQNSPPPIVMALSVNKKYH
jgi:hypothetical protein